MGDSFQCAVALANIEVIERENLLERGTEMGALLKKGLEELQTKFEVIGDVRGMGLFLGLEIIESTASRRPDPERGLGTNTVRLCPPLVITEEQVITAIDIIEDVLTKI
jgi:4-aminobutyrate aminotransferase-like enzyme